jgi:DNA polymerase III sliding clamp (beta) subunit (PCNA family)
MAKAAVVEKVASVSIPQKTLAEMAAYVSKFSGTVQIALTQVVIQQHEGRLSLTCCDGVTWARRDCEAVGDDILLAVSASEFTKSVSALPLGDVNLELGENSLLVSSGKAKYTIPIAEHEDFPAMPEYADDEYAPIDPKWAEAVASITNPCFTKEAQHGVYCGVRLGEAVATTNTHYAHRIDGFGDTYNNIILHARYAKMLPQFGFICFQKGSVALRGDGVYIVGAAVQGNYPNVDRLYSFDAVRYSTIESAPLLEALERASKVAEFGANKVRLSFGESEVDVEASALGQHFKETLPCVGINIDGFVVACNYKYLADCIKLVNEDAVKLDFWESMRNFKVHGEGNYIGVICPMALA